MWQYFRLACSFCGRSEADVAKLVAGPRMLVVGPKVYICDACVELSARIMEGSEPDATRAQGTVGNRGGRQDLA